MQVYRMTEDTQLQSLREREGDGERDQTKVCAHFLTVLGNVQVALYISSLH